MEAIQGTVADMAASYAARIAQAQTEDDKIALTADWILADFDTFYQEIVNTPRLAQQAFEQRDFRTSLQLSKRRLLLYSSMNAAIGERLEQVFPECSLDAFIWDDIEARFVALIAGRYEADVAFAYIHSVRRRLYQVEWQAVEYAFGQAGESGPSISPDTIYRRYHCSGPLQPEIVLDILAIPDFTTPYRDADADAALLAQRINQALAPAEQDASTLVYTLDIIRGGFFRNRGAYLVGRIIHQDSRITPLVLALLNSLDHPQQGIYVDAVLLREAYTHNLFSSTLANFHVTNPYYREISEFLHSIMPTRPLGLHYTTIGYNHVGKVAVMHELRQELARPDERFTFAPGSRGTVAIGFATPHSAYNLKVIRDQPTAQYKWGEYAGTDAVLQKYGQVHDINRTGSMLDNIIYYRIRLQTDWFAPDLLEELLSAAGATVSERGPYLFFKHLIVQRRLTPLPVFLQTASPQAAQRAMLNLGYCIKNNTAANIFNKDLDARNYGINRFHKVYLFDYDALEPFTDVKIRTNSDRFDGEEDIPDWFFEDGVIFLPEEIDIGLNIDQRELRRAFREAHGDLLTTDYWERIQNALLAGKVPNIQVYPESCELRQPGT